MRSIPHEWVSVIQLIIETEKKKEKGNMRDKDTLTLSYPSL